MYDVVHYGHQPFRDASAACATPGNIRPRTTIYNMFTLSPHNSNWHRIFLIPLGSEGNTYQSIVWLDVLYHVGGISRHVPMF